MAPELDRRSPATRSRACGVVRPELVRQRRAGAQLGAGGAGTASRGPWCDAPDLAETHLARAMLAAQLGEGRETVKALVKALDIAPTYAHAHQYLAQLQCEAGNAKEGMERARLAHDLEPSLVISLFDIARLHALHGNREESERVPGDRRPQLADAQRPTLHFRLRVAAWFGDLDDGARHRRRPAAARMPTALAATSSTTRRRSPATSPSEELDAMVDER